MTHWQLQEAKARLSEVVRRAVAEGPQAITVHGRNEVVVLSTAEYERLARPRPSLVELLQSSPWAGLDLDLERDRSPVRKVEL
ncbi:MAG TPA: type II toxin-antitoxin system Phd/YefM family antitoxin [Thermoanaerobaculia bacterium]|nr:type II toxin-antitoxin system Phd/YefM family antitoxin [Thermoanaerobaculia bacterium]